MKWDGGPQPSMPTLRCTEEELNAARLMVCGNAQNPEDARLLLEMLGLIPESSATAVADDD